MAMLPPGSRVADLGGHRDRKRGSFDIRQFPLDVVCVNVSNKHGADVIADAAQLPFANDSFDVVLCAELLEHVSDPKAVLREAFRVLKPGGKLVACSPFLYHIHGDPHDYGRYTDHYWKTALKEIGFVRIEVERQGRFWSAIYDQIRHVSNRWTSKSHWYFLGLRSQIRQGIGYIKRIVTRWDTQPAPEDSVYWAFTTGFGIIARKRANERE